MYSPTYPLVQSNRQLVPLEQPYSLPTLTFVVVSVSLVLRCRQQQHQMHYYYCYCCSPLLIVVVTTSQTSGVPVMETSLDANYLPWQLEIVPMIFVTILVHYPLIMPVQVIWLHVILEVYHWLSSSIEYYYFFDCCCYSFLHHVHYYFCLAISLVHLVFPSH